MIEDVIRDEIRERCVAVTGAPEVPGGDGYLIVPRNVDLVFYASAGDPWTCTRAAVNGVKRSARTGRLLVVWATRVFDKPGRTDQMDHCPSWVLVLIAKHLPTEGL